MRVPDSARTAAVVVTILIALVLFALLPELSLVSAPVYQGF